MDGSTNLLMLEAIFIESVLLVVLGLTTYKIRKDFYAIKDKYKRLKSTVAAGTTLATESSQQFGSGYFFEHLTQARDMSIARYKANNNGHYPKIHANATDTENIAALRSLYLTAECEAFSMPLNSSKQWSHLERALKSLLPRPNISDLAQNEPSEKDQKIALLQERLSSLKNSDKKLQQKCHQLEMAEHKVGRLEERNKSMLEGLNRIRQINRSLYLVNEPDNQSKWMKVEEFDEDNSLHFALENLSNAQNSLDLLNQANDKKFEIAGNIIDDICNNDESTDALKHKLKNLQDHLEKSQSEIGSLTHEIETLKRGVKKDSNTSAERENPDVITETVYCDPNDELLSCSRKDQTLKQVHLLQNNNSEQRQMITDLRRDISILEDELQSDPKLTKEEIDEKTEKIEKLESLIRECDHCILALESEVEMLYNQLANIEDQKQLEENAKNINEQQEIERLNQELEQITDMMNNTMTLYGDQSIITQFSMESAEAKTSKDILIALDSAARNMKITPAIAIRTKSGNCQLAPQSHFNENDIAALNSTTQPIQGNHYQANDKEFFWNSYLSIAIADIPDTSKRSKQIIDNLSLLINIATSEIERIDNIETSAQQQKTLKDLLKATKEELTNIEIQQSYQANEFHLVLNALLKEVYTVSKSNELPQKMRVLLNNIVKETNERSAMLFASGSMVTKGYTELIETLESKLTATS